MLHYLLILTIILLSVLPASAQRRYQYNGRRDYSNPNAGDQNTGSQNAGNQNAGNQNASIFTGAPSPENLPNENQKGFGQNSHWLDRPGATKNIDALSKQVDDCMAKGVQAQKSGNKPGMFQANAAMQNLLRQLESMEPQNAKWKYLKATTYVVQAGGPSRSGTAGDRFTLQQALRELDMAAACPNASEWSGKIQALRAKIEPELARRVERGKEIKRAGVREMLKYRGPAVDTGSGGASWCTVCGHMHGGGQCTYRRD